MAVISLALGFGLLPLLGRAKLEIGLAKGKKQHDKSRIMKASRC